VPRFSTSPEDLLASIVALSEQTSRLALDSALEAAQADALGKVTVVVEQVCRLAVGAGVATGEIAWLAGELGSAGPDERQRAQSTVAIASAQSSLLAVGFAIQDLADSGGPREIRSSAEALQRAALQLEDCLAALSHAPVAT
jgi:methyl-accepting chemotaxis protein